MASANEDGDEAHHGMTSANDEHNMTVDAHVNANVGDEVNTTVASAIEDAEESQMIEIMASMASANEINFGDDDAVNMTVDAHEEKKDRAETHSVNMTVDGDGVDMAVASTNEEDGDGVDMAVA